MILNNIAEYIIMVVLTLEEDVIMSIADKKKYMKRIIDDQIERYLKNFGAVCIEGPKWCGKTWTSSYQ